MTRKTVQSFFSESLPILKRRDLSSHRLQFSLSFSVETSFFSCPRGFPPPFLFLPPPPRVFDGKPPFSVVVTFDFFLTYSTRSIFRESRNRFRKLFGLGDCRRGLFDSQPEHFFCFLSFTRCTKKSDSLQSWVLFGHCMGDLIFHANNLFPRLSLST